MASNALSRPAAMAATAAPSFAPVVAWGAIGGGLAGLVYALAFVVLRNDALAAAMLALGGGLTLVVYTGLYDRLAPAGAGFARLALVFGLLGGAGALVHGGYDLASALHPPVAPNLDLPSAIDPRGLLTFGAGGVALLIVAPLLGRAGFPRGLGRLGACAAALMLVLYAGRLVILDAGHPLIVVAALLSGFLVSPAWNLWLGVALLKPAR